MVCSQHLPFEDACILPTAVDGKDAQRLALTYFISLCRTSMGQQTCSTMHTLA